MTDKHPSVSRFMTQVPHTLSTTESAARAKEIMTEGDFRHIPVMESDTLIGIVSLRDVDLALAVAGPNDAPKLGEICERSTYVTAPQASILEVAMEMELRKIGSVVVMDHNRVVGIFTVTDVLRALRHAYT